MHNHNWHQTNESWYVILLPDNDYPVTITPDKERAEYMAKRNGYKLIKISSQTPYKTLHEGKPQWE